MKTAFLLCGACVVAMCAYPAFAQEAPKVDVPKDAPSAAAVSLEDCKRLLKRQVERTPSDDVAFKPGVDVHGKAVAPANAGQILGEIALPDKIVIDFGMDFAGRYGISGAGLHTATADVLAIEYDLALGGLKVNGKPLTQDDSRAVAKACALMLKNAEATPAAK